jgi:hypothetical protein
VDEMKDKTLSNMKENVLEMMIESNDIAVELSDRAKNEFDEMLVNRLNAVVNQLELLWKELKDETKI